MSEAGEGEDIESTDTMDLATSWSKSFSTGHLSADSARHRFAIQATHCLENLHR
jgi:hypothetical protein